MDQKQLNTHFFNVADSYIEFHKKAAPEMQLILDELEAVEMEKRDAKWAKDVDLITDIFNNAKEFTIAVQTMIIEKHKQADEMIKKCE